MYGMNATTSQVEKILKGDQVFSQLGFAMMVARLKKTYAKDPSSATLRSCTSEVNAFLEKFKDSMANDYAIIAKL